MLKSDIAVKLRLPAELAVVGGPRNLSEFIPRFHTNSLTLALSMMSHNGN